MKKRIARLVEVTEVEKGKKAKEKILKKEKQYKKT